MVEAHLSELVDDHGNLAPAEGGSRGFLHTRVAQQAPDERGLPAAEKARHDENRNEVGPLYHRRLLLRTLRVAEGRRETVDRGGPVAGQASARPLSIDS